MRLPLWVAFSLGVAFGFHACASRGGGGDDHDDDVTVRRYEDARGNPPADPNALGMTFYMKDGDDAAHGADGYNSLVAQSLETDADPDRIVRVVIHELLNVLVLADGGRYHPRHPEEYDAAWYLADGDSRAPLYPMPADEAAWVARHGPYHVHLQARDAWLRPAVEAAVARVNEAAGRSVFGIDG